MENMEKQNFALISDICASQIFRIASMLLTSVEENKYGS